MKVSIIGTVGLPANYGGFETLVEQLVRHNKSDDLQYTVFCSRKSYVEKRWVYHGARIEYIDLSANGIQSILYDIVSLIKAVRTSDVILILGVSGSAFLPLFRLFSKKKLIINIDGLEHKRDKWNGVARKFLKYSEKNAIRYGDVIVTDNKGITDYVKNEYEIDPELIAYGGDHVLQDITQKESDAILFKYSIKASEYSLGICRIEPENNVHIILEAFKRMPNKQLLFIGNWDKSEYGRNLRNKYSSINNIRLQSPVYDLRDLYVLRDKCKFYIHGHSAGGTNPSLVEAMFFRKPIIAFDCVYNRESTENKALYFKNDDDIIHTVREEDEAFDAIADKMYEIASHRYQWDIITKQYEQLYLKQ